MEEYINLLLAEGFDVLVPRNYPNRWILFSKDGKIGKVGKEHGGYQYATAHKPNQRCGTGFGVPTNAQLTLENAIKTIDEPCWIGYTVQYWKSLTEYRDNPMNKFADYELLLRVK